MSRLFILSFWYEPNRQAPVFRIKAMENYLSKDFDEVVILTRRFANSSIEWQDIIRPTGKFVQLERHGKVIVNRIPVAPLKERIQAVAAFRAKNFAALRRINWAYLLKKGYPLYHAFTEDFHEAEHQLSILPQPGDVLICSGPPFELFEIGVDWKKRFGCTLVFDYRDMWTSNVQRMKKGFFHELQLQLVQRKRELELGKKADLLVAVCESHKQALEEFFPTKAVVVCENGYEADLLDLEDQSVKRPFRLLYVGSLYPQQDSKNTFFKHLESYLKLKSIEPESFQLIFAGSDIYKEVSNRFPEGSFLYKYIREFSWLDRDNLIGLYKQANALLHLQYEGSDGIPSAKLYEYLAVGKPVFFSGSTSSIQAEYLLKGGVGRIIQNLSDLEHAIETITLSSKSKETQEFVHLKSRRVQISLLSKYLQSIRGKWG